MPGSWPPARRAPARPVSVFRDEPKYEERDSNQAAERRAGRKLGLAETSSFWWRETWREIAESPGQWLRLVFSKMRIDLNHYEFTDNQRIYFAESLVPLWALPWPGYRLAVVLAFAGIAFVSLRRPPTGVLLVLFLASQMGGVVPFHVAERYRLAAPTFPSIVARPGRASNGFKNTRNA